MMRALGVSVLLHGVILGLVFWWGGGPSVSISSVSVRLRTAPAVASDSTPIPSVLVTADPNTLPDASRSERPASDERGSEGPDSGKNSDPEAKGEKPSEGPTETEPISLKPSLAVFHPPAYPPQARKRGWEGVVLVEVTIDASGRRTAARILTSSGRRVLDEAALLALEQAEYTPAIGEHGPTEGTLEVAVRFEISPSLGP